MRLAAQEKLGFYPTPPEVGPELLKHLMLGAPTEKASDFHVIDPCAGAGEILKQIADGLHVPYKHVYAVELDKRRGEQIRAALPGAQVLAPCSLLSTLISHRSLSLAFVNPPFDDQLGGNGREETSFVREAYNLLCENGVLIMVAPLRTYQGSEFRGFLDAHFKDQGLYRFATPVYNEVVMIARKRNNPLEENDVSTNGKLSKNYALSRLYRTFDYAKSRYKGISDVNDLPALGTIACDWVDGSPAEPHKLIRVWDIPPSWKPSRFAKADYLEEELVEAILASSNNDLYRAESEPDIAEAPLPLAEGHVALLVASGALDGLIEVPGRAELSHVMRGISRKVEQPNEEASKAVLSGDGNSMRITEVYSETMDTKIRCVDRTFSIFTFGLEPAKSAKTREYEVKIEETSGDAGTVVVPLIREGDSDYINILCGTRTIKFCFDTGAEVCSLSSADLKGVEYFVTGRTMLMTDAAGRTTPTKEIVIATMTVDGLTAKNVRCSVGEPTHGEIPALLGQNFLRLFDYAYSQSKATLTLTLAKKEGDEHERQNAA